MVKARKVAPQGKLADDPKTPKQADEENMGVKVKKGHLGQSVKAIKKLVEKQSANSNPLLGINAEAMIVIFTLTKVPDKRKMKPFMIPLPHSLYDEKSEICFLSKDPQKKYKELLLQKHPVPGLTKVIGIDKLGRNYKSLEQKRALADSYDLFLCDIAVAEMMPKLLGSVFYNKKKKPPIPVRLREANPEEQLKKAINGTPLRIPSGPCLTIKFGRADMGEECLTKNAATVIAYVVRHLKETAIQAISVKSTESPALPVWRRARADGAYLDMKKYHSDASSSAASDTGVSGSASETHATSDVEISDAGETLSNRDTVSEADTLDDYVESLSELDEEAGDIDDDDEAPATKAAMPLVAGLGSKKRKREGKAAGGAQSPKSSPKSSPKAAPKKAAATMAPPAKKMKKKAA
eukprot:TRINITY_DN5643_c0_g1_i1.p1 TRINITY_DN5643_c0_g1~~TRINITY_DN5643_c0_g1_i1.p1  ORF type:complete len:408 (-),score=147.24 TRINITY_DN5643_c0_g1_i1:261-1484(-)